MKKRAKPVWFQAATSGTILGHTVKIEGPQTLDEFDALRSHGKKHAECCIEIDGNLIHYEIGPHGVHSHSFMHTNFGTPWELAEALVRDYGALAVRGGPSADAPHQGHQHASSARRPRKVVKRRRR